MAILEKEWESWEEWELWESWDDAALGNRFDFYMPPRRLAYIMRCNAMIAALLCGLIAGAAFSTPGPPADLVVNGDFESWEAQCPTGWTIAPEASVRHAMTGYRGASAVEMPLPASTSAALAQEVNLAEIVPGTKLLLLCAVKRAAKNDVAVSVEYPDHPEIPAKKVVSGANKNWQRLRMSVELPSDAAPKTILLRVAASVTAGGPVLVDAISLTPCVPWRSALFPESWTSGGPGTSGVCLHDFSYAGYKYGLEPPASDPERKHFDAVADFGACADGEYSDPSRPPIPIDGATPFRLMAPPYSD